MKITTIVLAFALLSGVKTVNGQEQAQHLPVQEQASDVSETELKKFANIYKEVQVESQKMQKKAVGIIQTEGMDLERYQEISQAQNNPNKEVETNEKEDEKITVINTKIGKIQTKFQGLIANKIQEEGLTIKRYQEVYAKVQQDEELQQRLGKLING